MKFVFFCTISSSFVTIKRVKRRFRPLGIIFILFLSFLWLPDGVSSGPFTLDGKPVVVAVIDTGADVRHPVFQNLLWENEGETGLDDQGRDRRFNGVDDDKNGFVDDFNGWNFDGGNGDLTDRNGHGTHVAGLIERTFTRSHHNHIPLRLMILKYTDHKGEDSKESFVKALRYAIDMGANLINISASGRGFSKSEYDLLKRAREKGIQVVVATGNKRPGTPDKVTFPASYRLDNIHPVGALNSQGEILASSNRIHHSKVLYALGENLYSSLPGNSYGRKTGTSQATALISGRMAAYLANRVTPLFVARKLVMNPSNTLHN